MFFFKLPDTNFDCSSPLKCLSGIFEEDPLPDDDPSEEILVELRKKQQELRQLSNHNLQVIDFQHRSLKKIL